MRGLRFAPNTDDTAIVAHLATVVGAGMPVRLALAGGATPAPILAQLVALGVDFSRTEIWPTDERCVGEENPASNVAALRRAFSGTAARVHALQLGAPSPRFSLVWLGMGVDGHIASLFPRPDTSVDGAAAVIAVTPDPLPLEAPFDRLTLNYAALLNTDEIILVARGAAKRPLLDAAARGEGDLPIARLARLAGTPLTVYWRP